MLIPKHFKTSLLHSCPLSLFLLPNGRIEPFGNIFRSCHVSSGDGPSSSFGVKAEDDRKSAV